MKKYIKYILIPIVVLLLSPIFIVEAQTPKETREACIVRLEKDRSVTEEIRNDICNELKPASENSYYKLLAPINDIGSTINVEAEGAFGEYLNKMIKIFIGICAVLAVIMIVIGGIEYMTSDVISSKEAGTSKIQDALLGLLIALGSFALLNTINPDLLKSDIKVPEAVVTAKLTMEDQINNRLGLNSAACVSITDKTNDCHPDKLVAGGFTQGDANIASAICNRESRGLPKIVSGPDTCENGTNPKSFSFGLFQINIIAHGNNIPGGVCKDIFTINPNPPNTVRPNHRYDTSLGGCVQMQRGICTKYACTVKDPAKYDQCYNYLTNPVNNIKFALDLKNRASWQPWGADSVRTCKY